MKKAYPKDEMNNQATEILGEPEPEEPSVKNRRSLVSLSDF